MKVLNRAKQVLDLSAVYWALQRGLGAENVYRELLDEYAKPQAGERVLDVGCGPAKLLEMLPSVSYLGVDIDQTYLSSARKQFGDKGDFRLLGADAINTLEGPPFDVIFGVGLIHHLPDSVAHDCLAGASQLLGPGGRLVTVDPCLHPDQTKAAKLLVSSDRGEHVRRDDQYRELSSSHFASVELTVRHDLLRVPYSHAIQVCRNGTTD